MGELTEHRKKNNLAVHHVVAAAIDAYYDLPDHTTGGNLHIVLDDGNVEDSSILWCRRHAASEGDYISMLLADLLLQLDIEQRKNLVDPRWHRGWGGPYGSSAIYGYHCVRCCDRHFPLDGTITCDTKWNPPTSEDEIECPTCGHSAQIRSQG